MPIIEQQDIIEMIGRNRQARTNLQIHAGKQIDIPLYKKWSPGGSVPLGAIVCTARIDDFARVERGGMKGVKLAWWDGMRVFGRVPEDEFGDFSLGRYLWKLTAVEAVNPVVYIAGRQGLWDWAP